MRRSFWILLSGTLLAAFLSVKVFSENKKNIHSPASGDVSLSQGLLEEGEWALAAQQFEKEIMLGPKKPEAYLQLAILYEDYLKRTADAIKYYESYLGMVGGNEKTPLVRQWLKSAKDKLLQNPEKIETVEDLKKQLRSQENKVDAIRQEYENAKAKSHQQAISIQQFQNALNQKELKIRENEAQIKRLEDEKNHQAYLAKELDQANLKVQNLEGELITFKNSLQDRTQEVEELEKDKAYLAGQLQEHAKKLDKSKDSILLDENTQLRETKRIYEARLIKLKATLSALRASNLQLKRKLGGGTSGLSKPISKSARIYKVKRGESLRTIAISFYGDKDKWYLIYNANRGKITDPNVLTPGQILEIPQDPSR